MKSKALYLAFKVDLGDDLPSPRLQNFILIFELEMQNPINSEGMARRRAAASWVEMSGKVNDSNGLNWKSFLKSRAWKHFRISFVSRLSGVIRRLWCGARLVSLTPPTLSSIQSPLTRPRSPSTDSVQQIVFRSSWSSLSWICISHDEIGFLEVALRETRRLFLLQNSAIMHIYCISVLRHYITYILNCYSAAAPMFVWCMGDWDQSYCIGGGAGREMYGGA